MAKITENEWLSELQRLEAAQKSSVDGALTTRELCNALRMSSQRAQRLIRQLKEEGRIEVVRRKEMRIDGISTLVPAYRLLPKKR